MRSFRWARQLLSAFAGLAAVLCGLISLSSSRTAGWNNERTILYAAEGGLMSPRDSLAQVVLSGIAALTWLIVFAVTLSPPGSRVRAVRRVIIAGATLELVVGVIFGGLCGDWAGECFVAGILAFPMAVVAVAVRRRKSDDLSSTEEDR
jgi:hypothetical protein